MDVFALNKFSYGLYIVSTTEGKKTSACIINTAIQVTAEPLQIAITVNKENATCQAIQRTGHFCVTALTQDCDMPFIGEFGFKSSANVDKFANFTTAVSSLGDVYTSENAAAVVCGKVVSTLDLGTHILFAATVEDAEILSNATPVTYKYYHEVLKGKTPKKASAYLGEDAHKTEAKPVEKPVPTNKTTHTFRCLDCGYTFEYEGEELPDDFTCPLCGASKNEIERID